MSEEPKDWREVSYSNLGDVLSGFAFKSKLFSDDPNDFPLIRIRNLLSHSTETYYSGEYQQEYIVRNGDILIGMDGDFHTVKWQGGNALLNQRVCKIIPNCSRLNGDFSFYTMVNEIPKINEKTASTTVKHLSTKDIKSLKILLPPLPEQKKIASILSSVDETIVKTKSVIEQTKKLKQGLIQKLLTRGIGHTKFKKTEIGEIPEGWEVVLTDQICKQISVGIVIKPSQYYVPNGVKCFRSANVREGMINDSDWVYISEESNELLSKSMLQTGDVLVVRTGYPGTSCVVTDEYDRTNCIDIVFARPIKDKVSPLYLSNFINSTEGKKQIFKGQTGLAQKHFNVKSLKALVLPLPSIEEQKRIDQIIDSIESKILRESQTLDKLIKLKSSLMNQLLTGKTRVST